jgi:hypothetical protein
VKDVVEKYATKQNAREEKERVNCNGESFNRKGFKR